MAFGSWDRAGKASGSDTREEMLPGRWASLALSVSAAAQTTFRAETPDCV